MPSPECPGWETCEASLCPEDRESLERGLWYAGEGICRARRYQGLPWVRAQKRLAKVKAEGFFTLRMLEAISQVRRGIAGLNPDEPEASEEAWLRGRVPQKDHQAMPVAAS